MGSHYVHKITKHVALLITNIVIFYDICCVY